MKRRGVLIFLVVILGGCATYYQKNIEFARLYYNGNFNEASKVLDGNKKSLKPKNKLLYFMNKGTVEQQLGQFKASNNYFEQAYLNIENYRKNLGAEALSLISNPTVKPYPGEDFELVLIHYYMAINYVMLRDFEAALVECRRMNIKLNELNDKYKRKNRYSEDAFIQNLMGIIYEASGDYNNAFIAYRNSYDTYQKDYKEFFGIGPPEQLKEDLMRSAQRAGMYTELDFYQREFKVKYDKSAYQDKGEIVCLWNNGLGPVKAEWSINFSIIQGQGGYVTFANDELGVNFPFYVGQNENGGSKFGDLKLIRVAFPKYTERKPVLSRAVLKVEGEEIPFEMAEDINAIAFKTLQDRMLRELSNSLLRLAFKQLAEAQARKQNESLGAAVSIFNAITEKADTRNWQTLPYHISYMRKALPEGTYPIELIGFSGGSRNYSDKREVEIKEGRTNFELFTSIK